MLSELIALGMGAHKALEVYLASNGLKITRTMMDDSELGRIVPLLPEFGVEILLSKEKFLLAADVGKGGYGNSFGAVVPADHPQGHFCVYVGRDLLELNEARYLDEAGEDDQFGNLLGIPDCCRMHFSANKARFLATQNDPTLFIRNTGVVDPWCSHFPMYFGYGLFSHFPCSVDCAATRELAIRNKKLLREVSPKLADSFINYQFFNYLYSEYDGVFAFASVIKDQVESGLSWTYDNKKLEGTTSSLLSEIIFSCDCITVRDAEIEFKRKGAVRLLADASKFRVGFHCATRA